MFDAIVFSVYQLGFVARCALEADDAGESRLSKIERLIYECRFGINDLSRATSDSATTLPRFNMPLELGLFLGCKRFGPANQNGKRILILDSDPYRYRQFISNIAGQDIRCHHNEPELAIREVRDWLQAASKRVVLPGGGVVVERYQRFRREQPALCVQFALDPDRLTFLDLRAVVADWMQANPLVVA